MALPGLQSLDNSDRVDSGSGYVHEHSIEIGNTVVTISNIGTITLISGNLNPVPLLIGIILCIIGLPAMVAAHVFGFLILACAIGLIIWHFNQKPDIYLSIGSSDGRRTNIVSKDKDFLLRIRDFLRQKIDEKNGETATINISAKTITGGIAVGSGAQAAGAAGTINNESNP